MKEQPSLLPVIVNIQSLIFIYRIFTDCQTICLTLILSTVIYRCIDYGYISDCTNLLPELVLIIVIQRQFILFKKFILSLLNDTDVLQSFNDFI